MNKFLHMLEVAAFHRLPYRILIARRLIRRFPFASYSYRASIDAVERPQYAYCMLEAAKLARFFGLKKFSIIEFGVAGGNGLVNIETHVEEIRKEFGVDCEVYGFDSGEGLPSPNDDYRNIPYIWGEGFYKMDRPKLERRLKFSKLVIGNVKDTCSDFYEKYKPAPLGCVIFDLDYYTSTLAAFEIFNTRPENRLPRISCYFDDILGSNEFVGELNAINKFNKKNQKTKIAPVHLLAETRKVSMPWNHGIFVFHDFEHRDYNTCFRESRNMMLKD